MANGRYRELRKPTLASLQEAQLLAGKDGAILEYVLWEGEKKEERRETFRAVGVSIRNLEISEGAVDFTDGRTGARHRIGGINVHIPYISLFPEDLDKADREEFGKIGRVVQKLGLQKK